VFADHSREWRTNHYIYPVVSRRSGGLSIGVNLNPDAACNFDCVYCQVDRSQPPRVRKVDLASLESELAQMLDWALDGSLFTHPQFADVPDSLRRLNDIAFSGDGEPTTCPVFPESVALAARLKADRGLDEVKLVLITDACYLTRPKVAAALEVMDQNNGEIWAKLDAGTEAYFRRVNRPNFSLEHVTKTIAETAKLRPIVIQSLWMRLDGHPPPKSEVETFVDRLRVIQRAGGQIARVQVYTVARQPAEPCVAPLDINDLERIAARVRERTGLVTVTYA
jgi:wyosine [tRNA(Phe)-imidazoG37] synthetase (radical SAM superfamily)